MKSPNKRSKQPNSHVRLSNTMTTLESFEIELEPIELSTRYKPGQNISGKVIVKNSDYIVCRAIRVALEGSAIVSYQSEKSGHTRSKSESLLEGCGWTTIYLVGSATQGSKQSHLLKRATHQFPFTICIQALDPFPGSLKAPHGEILYRVSAYIDNFYSKIPTTVTKMIKIKGHLNLLSIPMSTYPVVLNGKTKFSPIHEKTRLTLQLSRTTFLPWEKIPFKLTLINIDPHDMMNFPTVLVSLVKRTIFKTDVSSRCIEKTLSFIDHSEDDWDFMDLETYWNVEWNDALNIPEEARIPSFSDGIMQCIYSFKLEMQSASCICPFVGEVPITIGTTRQK